MSRSSSRSVMEMRMEDEDKLRDLLFHTGVKRIVLRSPTYKVLEGGKNNAAPQIAKLGTKTIVNGGYEDE